MNIDRKLIASAVALLLLMAVFVASAAAALPTAGSNPLIQDPAPPTEAERALFTQGQNLYLQGSYTRSTEVLEQFLDTYPKSILTDLTLLWLGRSYLKLGKFKEAESVGQRLHAITDTPFADIYDTELRTAMREATQQADGNAIRNAPAAPKQISASSAPTSGRNRFAKAPVTKPNAPPVGARNKVTNAGRRSVAVPAKGKSTQLARGPRSAAPKSRASGQTVAAKQKTPPAVASNNRRESSPSKPKQSGATSSAGKTPRAASTSTASTPRKNIARVKPPSNRSSATAGARERSGTLATNRSPAKKAVRAASSKQNAKQNSPASNNRSNRTNNRPVNQAPAQSTTPADLLTAPASSPADVQRAPVVNAHAATGGLYSMIETGLSPTAPPVVSSNTAAASDTRVDAKLKGMNAKPGETIYLSFVVRNYGSIRQTYELRVTAPGAPEAQLFVDSNGDGQHQNDELRVTGSPVVELKNSEVPFLLQITIPRTAREGQQYSYTVTVISFGSGEVVARTTSTLTVSSIRASLVPINNPESSQPSLAK